MKMTIERSTLLRSLTHVQSVVERRNTIPVLSNVAMRARNGTLELIATDLDIQVEDTCVAEVSVEGQTTVAAALLFDIVRKVVDGSQISIETEAGRMKIVAGRSRFSMGTLPMDDFPLIARGELAQSFTITTQALQNALKRTGFAVSTEETRYYLNGVFLHILDGKLLAAATDGHRLSQTTVDIGDQDLSGMPDIIVPRKTVAQLVKLVAEFDGEIDVTLSGTKIAFDLGRIRVTSKTVDGTYPDYSRVIPKNNPIEVMIDVKALAQAVDRVSIIASEKTRAVKMEVIGDIVRLTVRSPENGDAVDELPCSANGNVEVGFNSRYLLDLLGEVTADQVSIHLADGAAPVLFRDSTRPNDNMVLMPMRV